MDDSIYWAHLAAVEGMGGALFEELQKRFGSLKRALEAPLHEVKEIPSMDERTAEAICRAAQTLPATQAKVERLARLGVRLLTRLEAAYPSRLRLASNPPPVVYLAGQWQPADEKAVALIGSRDCSAVSSRRAREYARYFAQEGVTVISGYAAGVDISAHLGALEAGGRTIIIPGCGADYFDFAPLKSLDLNTFESLSQQGIWLSEQTPEADWSSQGSLARNRLVAAWAEIILVIEARTQSSTLDTVQKAQNLGRPIFVQSFATLSQRVLGNEMLRREGAGVIHKVDDLGQIVELLRGQGSAQKPKKQDDPRR